MRGTVCKGLRAKARAMSVGRSETEYVGRKRSRWLWKAKKAYKTMQCQIAAGCTRGIYRTLKWGYRRGLNDRYGRAYGSV